MRITMTVGKKLLAGSAVSAVLTLAVGFSGYWGIQAISDSTGKMLKEEARDRPALGARPRQRARPPPLREGPPHQPPGCEEGRGVREEVQGTAGAPRQADRRAQAGGGPSRGPGARRPDDGRRGRVHDEHGRRHRQGQGRSVQERCRGQQSGQRVQGCHSPPREERRGVRRRGQQAHGRGRVHPRRASPEHLAGDGDSRRGRGCPGPHPERPDRAEHHRSARAHGARPPRRRRARLHAAARARARGRAGGDGRRP